VWRSPNPIVARNDPEAANGLVWEGLQSSKTESQQQMPYKRGRGVGGSSAINGQIAIRPPMEDFDDWARLGISGWSADDVLPYFAKLEDDQEFGDTNYHGRGGPTPIFRTAQSQWGAVDSALAKSAIAAGFPWAQDVNAPGATGVSPFPINSRSGRRVSVNDSYIEPARSLPNLTIRGNALVDKVSVVGNRVAGVRVISNDLATVEYADEVVLSAGVIHSPAILLRSGVGPASVLRALGLKVNADLPVGQGLQDHPMTLVSLPLTKAAEPKTLHDRHTNVCVRTSSKSGSSFNDLMFVSDNQNGEGLGAFRVWLNQNYSRGTVTLTSLDPAAQPLVHQRLLSDSRDLLVMREGIRTAVDLALRPEVADILAGPIEPVNKALFSVLDKDSALDEYLLTSVADPGHSTSTCRMGRSEHPDTVVDSSCRVLGLDGLRVIDASIFPSVPRANTHLISIMAGEFMADRIE
jgi:choline dehydrogenase